MQNQGSKLTRAGVTHLVQRFFDVALARPLDAAELAVVEIWLSRPLAELFFDQPSHDQRHGYEAACSVITQGYDDPDVITAALMHDIGKRHARLGLVGRTLASVMILTRIPLPERFVNYRDHGLVGAREMGRVGAPSVATDFALHHHRARPETISPDVWAALQAADEPPKTLGSFEVQITSEAK